MESIRVRSKEKREVKDITEDVRSAIENAGKVTGVGHVFLLHTTAALAAADLDPGTDLDLLDAFAELVPRLEYRHPHDPGHVQDHILSSMLGTSLAVAVKEGEIVLGTWQRIVLLEFDGPRERHLVVCVTAETG